MKLIGVTQRIVLSNDERRDALDQKWSELLQNLGFTQVAIPNHLETAAEILKLPLKGILLTGGNSLVKHGGDAPERDKVETFILDEAIGKNLPVLGVCRGMQMIVDYFGNDQYPVQGHVLPRQEIFIHAKPEWANSYHTIGTKAVKNPLEVWAVHEDGVIKAVRHTQRPILGIMWHPERLNPFSHRDIELISVHFNQ